MTTDHTLATIRNAYRYIVAYERRVLDAIDVMHGHLLQHDFQFYRWWPLHNAFPKQRSQPWTDWAWDNTPLRAARFQWDLGGRQENQSGNAWFLIDHIADTGIERHQHISGEPDMLTHLPAAADCDSQLRAWWLMIDTPVAEAHWNPNLHKFVVAHFGEKTLGEVRPNAPTDGPVAHEYKGVHLGAHVLSLATITTPETFTSHFVEPVISALSSLLPQ